jgi:hypothetical protein
MTDQGLEHAAGVAPAGPKSAVVVAVCEDDQRLEVRAAARKAARAQGIDARLVHHLPAQLGIVFSGVAYPTPRLVVTPRRPLHVSDLVVDLGVLLDVPVLLLD